MKHDKPKVRDITLDNTHPDPGSTLDDTYPDETLAQKFATLAWT